MKFFFSSFFKILIKTFKSWSAKDPFRQSAVIAYYAIFSIPGLLVIIISIAGYFIDKQSVKGQIITQITYTMGAEIATQIDYLLIKTISEKSSTLSTILGGIVLLMGATGVFVELQKSLNAIWKVKAIAEKGIFKILKARIFSFGLILAIAFLLIVSLIVSTALASLSDIFKNNTLFSSLIFNVLNNVFTLLTISLLFALIFKILPDAKIDWGHVWIGSLLTGILFTIGKSGLALYFGQGKPASGYGTAGPIVLILLWVSYSTMILFFGAEFTSIYAKEKSGVIKPTKIAIVDLQPKI